MDFNFIVFPRPTLTWTPPDLLPAKIIYIPYHSPPHSPPLYHIPCLFTPNPDLNSKKFILYFHGNGEDIGHCKDISFHLSQTLRINVLSMEYPGYGIYKGSPDEDLI